MVPIRINRVLINTRRVLNKLRRLLANDRANRHHQTGHSASKTSKHSNHADTALNAPRLQAAHNRVQTQRNENSAGHPTHQGTHIIENVVGEERQTHAHGHEETKRDRVVHHGGLAVADHLRCGRRILRSGGDHRNSIRRRHGSAAAVRTHLANAFGQLAEGLRYLVGEGFLLAWLVGRCCLFVSC